MSDGRPYQILSNYLYQPQAGGGSAPPTKSYGRFDLVIPDDPVPPVGFVDVYRVDQEDIVSVTVKVTLSTNYPSGGAFSLALSPLLAGAVDPIDGSVFGFTFYTPDGNFDARCVLNDGSCVINVYLDTSPSEPYQHTVTNIYFPHS